MPDFSLHHLGTIMSPESGSPYEVEGVLNPAAVRGPDGDLYLFPRLVAKGNYSRIGIAKVCFNGDGDPTGVERLGIALEPEADYERGAEGFGGCEDPRITYIVSLKRYFMTYVALSEAGPRVALAISKDLLHWARIGLVHFTPYRGVDFADVDDKDSMLFPLPVDDPSGQSKIAILHRPHFRNTGPGEEEHATNAYASDLDRKSIWISYCNLDVEGPEPFHLGSFSDHQPLASPSASWEQLKVGGGTPPILTPHGWMLVYHGVSKVLKPNSSKKELCYAAGVIFLSKSHPREILYRTHNPILTLSSFDQQVGTKADVVFPTGIDRRDDLGLPDRFDIYYGMGDTRIGAASIRIPSRLADLESFTSIEKNF